MSIKVSASTNPPKTLEELFEYIKELNKTQVDYIHCEVMDGKFDKAKTFGAKVVKLINNLTEKTLDVHLMVKHPTFKLKGFVKAGADILTVHFEAYKNKKTLIKTLQKIRSLGTYAGLSFNPNTPVLEILPYIAYCDMLLVMSVVPGKSGQEFMPETLLRLKTINEFIKEQGFDTQIEVDGGVNKNNVSALKELNVNSVVVGNYLYSSSNYKKAVADLKKA